MSDGWDVVDRLAEIADLGRDRYAAATLAARSSPPKCRLERAERESAGGVKQDSVRDALI